jgi:hypothetical protein
MGAKKNWVCARIQILSLSELKVYHYSKGATSPPEGVTADQKIVGFTEGATVRTLPSNNAINIPLECGDCGMVGSHSPNVG